MKYSYSEGIEYLGGNEYYLVEPEYKEKIKDRFSIKLSEDPSIIYIRESFVEKGVWVFKDMSGISIISTYSDYLYNNDLKLLKAGLTPIQKVYFLHRYLEYHDLKFRIIPESFSDDIKLIKYYRDRRYVDHINWPGLYANLPNWDRA